MSYKHKYSLTIEFELPSLEEDGSDALKFGKIEACQRIQSEIDKVMDSPSLIKCDLEDTIELSPSDLY